MGHQETYRQNQEYTDFLASWDEGFYTKYAEALKPGTPGQRVLDVGCGVGQVVRYLQAAGVSALGVDVSETSIARACQDGLPCQVYDGRTLPFPAGTFAGVGALNVLEHVEQPEAFLAELVRVTRPGGRIVVSSPNFLRALGWRDYHPRMRGLGNKLRNARRLLAKARQMRRQPTLVRFDRMEPIVKEPFTPDDDAIVATNGLEMAFFLCRAGCVIERIECTDRRVMPLLDWMLNLTPLRYALLNAFVIARRKP